MAAFGYLKYGTNWVGLRSVVLGLDLSTSLDGTQPHPTRDEDDADDDNDTAWVDSHMRSILRRRHSTDVWCLDVIGRDAGIGLVGRRKVG